MQELLAAIGANSEEYAQAITSLPQEQKDQAASRIVDLDALQSGRANIDIRATAPKTGPQRQQELMQMAQAGMFDPERLDVTIPMLELMQIEDFDKLRAQLLRVLVNRQAKAQQDMEAAQQAQSEATQVEAAKAQAQVAKGEQDAQLRQMELQLKAEESSARLEQELEIAKLQASTQLQIALIGAQKGSSASQMPPTGEGEDEGGNSPTKPTPAPVAPMGEDDESELPEALTEESFEAIQQAIREGMETPQFEAFEHSPSMANLDPEYAAMEAQEGQEDEGEGDDTPMHPDYQ
jgi:hypothetical protein